MLLTKLQDFTRGWLVGNFHPAILKTTDFEFAVQYFEAGQKHDKHYHKVAEELTVIVYGEFDFNGQRLTAGDVVLLKPGEAAEFLCLKQGATAVVKIPSVKGDKYIL